MWEDKFVHELNKKLVKQYKIKQDFIDLEYLKEQGWRTHLNNEEQIFTMQILFQKYLFKMMNEGRSNDKAIMLDNFDMKQIELSIQPKIQKLNSEKQQFQ